MLSKIRKTAMIILKISFIVFLVVFFFSKFIIYWVFGYGKFDRAFLPLVHLTFIFYLFQLVPYAIGVVYVRAHLVFKNSKTLMKLGFISLISNITLNFILMKWLGVSGIALSTSLTVSMITILLFLSTRTLKVTGKR
jgi:putative peptidoglycan lipid II flippase